MRPPEAALTSMCHSIVMIGYPRDGKPWRTVSPDPSETYCWSDKIKIPGFSAAPVRAFEHSPFASCSDLLRYNVKIEVPNADYALEEEPFFTASCYWIATPIRVEGYKVLLRYEGFEGNFAQDFWMNICTADVHPVTWCAKSGNILRPPKTLDTSTCDWAHKLGELLSGSYSLPDNHHDIVREHCKQVNVAIRLETIDYRSNPNAVVPMTVKSSVSSRVNVVEWHDNSPENGEIFQINCNIKSPILFPVGWASYFEYPFRCSEGYSRSEDLNSDSEFGFTVDDERLFSSEIELVRRSQRDCEDGCLSCFLNGMKVEAIDPLRPTEIRVGTIVKTLRNDYYIVRFDGTDVERCYHCSSALVLPAGFSEAAGIALSPPTGFEENFTWPSYLAATDSMAANHSIFKLEPNGNEFQVGQWLEATNVMRNGEIFPASIVQICGRLLRIQFDGYSEKVLHWFDSGSPDIYPVGWCEMVGVQLSFPSNALSEKSMPRKEQQELSRPAKTPSDKN
ncbi:hypothetical protein M514_00557 [Trichuris suis]|uniref:Mbt repeat protein n=1 Tax=Trichuris suis TaxID=68888 RepID=A0A085NDB0_9BILA|nr:hypothetical protein M514_00557 [Trichuris suis]